MRPIKRQARLTTGGVYIILVVAVLLAAGIWETVRMYTRSPVAPVVENVTDDLNMKTIECVDYKIPPEKLWFGLPAPAPMAHIRETAPYLAWRERFQNALPLIEKDGHAAQALELREWFYEYQASQIRSIKNGSKPPAVSPLFSQLEIQRFVRKPPQPAFEKFFGYKIVLPWEKSVYYYAPNNLKPQTKYPLSKEGIFYAGTPVRAQKDIAQVFRPAGVVDPLAQNVLIKVSGQECGFDAVNTWDTGYFSVGFIQFTTGDNPTGRSLVSVMQRMKSADRRSAKEFDYYFTRRGIDVRQGQLVVKNPATNKMLTGAAAVTAIIDDKRLIAVFQNAGARSKAFQVAQVREAYQAYYMADKYFRLPVAEITEQVEGQPERIAYVYGDRAISLAVAQSSSADSVDDSATDSSLQSPVAVPGASLRSVQRLPDIIARYRDVLPSEGGLLALTDRAVQKGVSNAEETFTSALIEIAGDQPLVVKNLRWRAPELILKIRNRIDVVADRQAAKSAIVVGTPGLPQGNP